jgi:hypothetical protein
MSDAAREVLELRAILVSTRAALRHTEPADLPALRTTADELLARLEERVIRDGANPQILAAIHDSRRTMWDD